MKTDIYKLHDAAFAQVSAFVIMKDNERVATIAFKFPRDGAGRLYAYVHWLGVEMVRGHANGYGYDKKSAAVESAVAKLLDRNEAQTLEFANAVKDCGGDNWNRCLEKAGFTVLQAV